MTDGSPPEPSVSVVVPATSANLGCAFDCAGLALNLYLRAAATVSEASGFDITYRGPNADEVPRDESNLILQAMWHFAERTGANLPGADIAVENSIPLGRGLGSSAAAIVAGIKLGAGLCGMNLDSGAVLRLALEIEGHPDNIAAAIYGGFVVAAVVDVPGGGSPEGGEASPAGHTEVYVSKAEVSEDLDFVAVIPDVALPTEKARAALPGQYSRVDAVANLQRTALLTAAFFSGKRLSPELFRDRLHQPYRSALVPGIAECLAFRHPGLAGVYLSGAGSAVMAIAEHQTEQIAEALTGEFRRRSITADWLVLKADNRGAQLSTSSGGHAFTAPART